MYTLTLVFNKAHTHVLMFYDNNLEAYNYIGGKVEEMEDIMEASYRKLFEATGITKNLVDLKLVRNESVYTAASNSYCSAWSMQVTAGTLKESDIMFSGNKDLLVWIDIRNIDILLNKSASNGYCYLLMKEALDVLKN